MSGIHGDGVGAADVGLMFLLERLSRVHHALADRSCHRLCSGRALALVNGGVLLSAFVVRVYAGLVLSRVVVCLG